MIFLSHTLVSFQYLSFQYEPVAKKIIWHWKLKAMFRVSSLFQSFIIKFKFSKFCFLSSSSSKTIEFEFKFDVHSPEAKFWLLANTNRNCDRYKINMYPCRSVGYLENSLVVWRLNVTPTPASPCHMLFSGPASTATSPAPISRTSRLLVTSRQVETGWNSQAPVTCALHLHTSYLCHKQDTCYVLSAICCYDKLGYSVIIVIHCTKQLSIFCRIHLFYIVLATPYCDAIISTRT